MTRRDMPHPRASEYAGYQRHALPVEIHHRPMDSGYRRKIHTIISNVSSQTQELSKGYRVGQLVIIPVVIADFVSELGEQRGTGGLGSTGN